MSLQALGQDIFPCPETQWDALCVMLLQKMFLPRVPAVGTQPARWLQLHTLHGAQHTY